MLSVFFGFGVVLLTVIQTLAAAGQAGLEDFLLGSTAGMLRSEALLIAVGGALTLALTLILRRPMLMTAFGRRPCRGDGGETSTAPTSR